MNNPNAVTNWRNGCNSDNGLNGALAVEWLERQKDFLDVL